MDRNLKVVVREDGGLDIVELSPGPYSFSSQSQTVLFSLTAGEAEILDAADPDARVKSKHKGK